MATFGATIALMMGTLKRVRGVAAVYHRANGHEVNLTLVPAKQTRNVITTQGRLTITTHDWLVLVSDLLDNEEQFLPARRERITVNDVIYEVLPDHSFEQWEYFDTSRQAIRIRTNVISE